MMRTTHLELPGQPDHHIVTDIITALYIAIVTDIITALYSFVMIGPSVTPFTNLNLGYRIYAIDGDYKESTNVSNACISHSLTGCPMCCV